MILMDMKKCCCLPLFILILLTSCNKFDDISSVKQDSDLYKIKLARDLFDKEIELVTHPHTRDEGSEPATIFDVGLAYANWESAFVNKNYNTDIENVESSLTTHYLYYSVQTAETGEKIESPCFRSLLISTDHNGKSGVFVMWYIPSPEYYVAHKGDLSQIYNNGGNMGDFCGLKIYTTINGLIVRINKYQDGRKTAGAFFPSIKTKQAQLRAKRWASGLFSDIRFNVQLQSDTKYWIPGEPFDYDIEESFCWDEECEDEDVNEDCWNEEENEQDDAEALPECDPDDFEEGDTGFEDEEESKKEHVKITTVFNDRNEKFAIEGPRDMAEALSRQMLEQYAKKNGLLASFSKILDLFGNKITIKMEVVPLFSEKKLEHAKTTLGNHWIYYRLWDGIYSEYDDMRNGLFEEIFHVYQTEKENGWLNGDLEIEAKIFDSILKKEYNVDMGFTDYQIDCFYSCYTNPTEENFKHAEEVLHNNVVGFGYDIEKFPVSPELEPTERIKHIDELIEMIKNSD